MNRLVIVGNGFDLAFGNKTSVEDFLFYLLKKEAMKLLRSNEVESIFIKHNKLYVGLSRAVNDSFENVTNFISLYELFQEHFEFDSELLKKIVEVGFERNWFDIERAYFNELYRHSKRKISLERRREEIESLNLELERIISELATYLRKIETDFDLTKKGELAKYFVDRFEENLEFQRSVSGVPIKMMFVNFNYTSILSKVSSYLNNKIDWHIVHIHGDLVDTSDVNPVLMGYGDDMSSEFALIRNCGVNDAMKYIKSSHCSRNSNYSSIMKFCEMDDFEIFVVGHSMGMTDHHILRTLFRHKKCQNFTLFHRGSRENFMQKQNALANHFKDRTRATQMINYYDNRFCTELK